MASISMVGGFHGGIFMNLEGERNAFNRVSFFILPRFTWEVHVSLLEVVSLLIIVLIIIIVL
jgi:hypothetical protein